MAALYLHNALFIPGPSTSSSPSPPYPPPLSRHHSRTLSTGTLTSSGHSHTTEPLLPREFLANTSGSLAYQSLLDRQPSYPDGTRNNEDMSLSLNGDPTSETEKRRYWEQTVRRSLRIWKALNIGLGIIIAIWSTYSTVRYFIALGIYTSGEGKALALALGAASSVTVTCLFTGVLITLLQRRLVVALIPTKSFLWMRSVLLYLASFFFLCPSIINLVFTIIRRRSAAELDVDLRCHLDVDVVWSISPSKSTCTSNNWSPWLGLAIFRTVTTLALVVSFLLTFFQYNITRHPSHYAQRHRKKRRRPELNREKLSSVTTPTTTTTPMPTTPMPIPNMDERTFPNPPRHSGDRPLSCVSNSTSSNAECIEWSDEDAGGSCAEDDLHLSRLPSQTQQRITEAIYYSPQPRSAAESNPGTQNDEELVSFVDRFRMLVSQIARETEEGLEFARPDAYVTEVDDDTEANLYDHAPHFYNPNPAIPTTSSNRHSTQFYDEFGPPDDHVRILNSYIRRMPTIESLGSRELMSMYSGRMYTPSMHTLSRPATSMDWSGTTSEPPSRKNSLTLNTFDLAGPSGSGSASRSTSGSTGGHQRASPTPASGVVGSGSSDRVAGGGGGGGEWSMTNAIMHDSPIEVGDYASMHSLRSVRSAGTLSHRSNPPSASPTAASFSTARSATGSPGATPPFHTPSQDIPTLPVEEIRPSV